MMFNTAGDMDFIESSFSDSYYDSVRNFPPDQFEVTQIHSVQVMYRPPCLFIEAAYHYLKNLHGRLPTEEELAGYYERLYRGALKIEGSKHEGSIYAESAVCFLNDDYVENEMLTEVFALDDKGPLVTRLTTEMAPVPPVEFINQLYRYMRAAGGRAAGGKIPDSADVTHRAERLYTCVLGWGRIPSPGQCVNIASEFIDGVCSYMDPSFCNRDQLGELFELDTTMRYFWDGDRDCVDSGCDIN